MAQMNYDDFSKLRTTGNTPERKSYVNSPSYFYLADDGDTAIVRFNISSVEDLIVTPVHTIMLNGKRRDVECIKPEECPLCREGVALSNRIYIPVISYTTENDKVTAHPGIWNQPYKFGATLKSWIMDYGDLRNIIFKVTRIGKRGTPASYSLAPANPKVYRDEDFVADFSAFETFDLHRSMVLLKNKEEMGYYLENNNFPMKQKQETTSFNTMKEAAASIPTNVYDRPAVRTTLRDDAQPIRTVYRGNDFTFTAQAPASQEVQHSQETQSQTTQKSPRRYTY